MQLPPTLLNALQGLKGFDAEAFIREHQQVEPITSVRLNPLKLDEEILFNEIFVEQVPWSKAGFYLSKRPSFTFDPLFHAGCYYVQEASSMFLEQAFLQVADNSRRLKVLDLCAAPGGKSTHLQSLLSKESLLVSNDVIRSRANILKDNLIKWGGNNVVVTNNDPKDFTKLSAYFDVIAVDAPCSGSGLFKRDETAIKEWSENNVALCCQRQQRILADVLPALKEDGILIYSTCSYSPQEDEEVADWLTDTFPLQTIPLHIEASWNITEVVTKHNNHCYRFWPHLIKGEGFFMAVFRKTSSQKEIGTKNKFSIDKVSAKDKAVIEKWVALIEDFDFIKNQNTVYAWPLVQYNDMQFLLQNLRVLYSGTLVGELMRDKLIPHHALAMSVNVSKQIIKTELEEEQAIAYLQKKDFQLSAEKGWQLACYQNHPLGWMNVLHNRINNYYPKELRILKEVP